MNRSTGIKAAILAGLHLLWGLVLWFSISKYGLGVSTDSVHFLFGGMNFWAGRGLVSYDQGFLILWPPLYPVLLGLVHGIFQLTMLAAANALQMAAFAGLAICLVILFLRIFEDNFLLAVVATVLADAGAVALISFDTAGSDYFGLFLIVLFLLLTGTYLVSESRGAFVGMAVVGVLAVLNRYLGIALVITGALAILVWSRGRRWKRLASSAVLAATALPGLLWLGITSQLYARRPPITFAENFDWFSRSILAWFVEARGVKHESGQGLLWLWIAILALIAVMLLLRPRLERRGAVEASASFEKRSSEIYLDVMMLFGLCYGAILFGAASMAYFNKLGGRFLLPLYIPLMTLPVAAASRILRRAREAGARWLRLAAPIACYASLVVIAGLLLQVTVPIAIESHEQGAAGGENAFNTKTWAENPAIQYWLAHVPRQDYVLLSNQPDGVAFQTQHAVRASPRETTGPYGTADYPIASYSQTLFQSGSEVYLLWIEPNPCSYCYGITDLAAIARVEPLSVSDEGGLYRLAPK